MTKMLKKLLAIGLALMFILSMPGVSTIVEAAFTRPSKGVWEIKDSGTYTINDTYKGYIVINTSQSVTLNGRGTIDASGYNHHSAILIKGGATVTINGSLTITGGTGDAKTESAMEPGNGGTFYCGGGVYIYNGTLNFNSGTITNNTANRGGGIFVENGAILNMNGGTISYNETVNLDGTVSQVAKGNYAGEGGGIFVYGKAYINGGTICYNKCNSKTDLGGGGLYVNNGAQATLKNALVYDNSAAGFGGGIAGCCHGESALVDTDGVALYNNTAEGKARTETDTPGPNAYYGDNRGRKTAGNVVDNYTQAVAAGITGANSADFYTAGSALVSNYMAGGGSAKYEFKHGSEKVRTLEDNEIIAAAKNSLVALKANPSDESIALAKKALQQYGGVEIYGNTSSVHGGGIGCNGSLYFGTHSSQEFKFEYLKLNLTASKKLNGATAANQAGRYTVGLYFDKECKNLAAKATNDEAGNFAFEFTEYKTLKDYITNTQKDAKGNIKSGTITFYAKEIIPENDETVTNWDKSVYKIEIALTGKTTTVTKELPVADSGNLRHITRTVTTTTYTQGNKTVTKIIDRNGVTLAEPEAVPSGIVFDNYDSKNLSLTKQVIDSQKKNSEADGNNVDTAKKFKFTIEFSTNKDLVAGRSFKATINDVATTDAVVSSDGKVTVELSDGQTYKIKDLPQTVGYTITEDTDNDYTSEATGVTSGTLNDDAAVTFTNTRTSGSLTLKKTVVQKNGDGTDGSTTNPDEKFEFTVTISGFKKFNAEKSRDEETKLNGTYSATRVKTDGTSATEPVVFTNGSAEVELKAGENVTIEGLPANVTYTVTESHANYDTSWEGNTTTGTITAGADAKVTATNTRKVGKLSLTKKVNSIQDDKSKNDEFTFTVTLSETITGQYGGMYFENGTAHVTLTAGKTVTAENLPVGATYNVVEVLSTRPEYEQVGIEPKTGTILEGETGVTVTATNKKKDGSLTVTKTVKLGGTKNAVSANGLSNEEFTFTVELGLGYDGKPVTGDYTAVRIKADGTKTEETVTFTNGITKEVKLSDGESITINGLPAGVTYTVTETENGNYVTSWTGETGVIPTNGTATVEAVNTRKTGSLKLTKTINDEIDKDKLKLSGKTYTFIITSLTDTTLNGTFTLQNDENPPVAVGVAKFENGTAKVEVAPGKTVEITGLPTGTYNVTEDDKDEKDPIVYKVETEVAGKKEIVNEEWTFAGVTGEGKVEVTADGEAQTVVASVEITNRYTRKAQFFPTVTKIVEGPARVDKEIKTYTFELRDEKGDLLGTATVTDKGSEGFQQNVPFYSPEGNLVVIDYSEIGVHNYTIKEVDNNNDPFFTYDKSTWNVQVFVENSDGDDKLEVRCAYTNGTDSYIGKGAAVTFTNVYAPTGSIAVTKTVEGIRPGDLNRTFTVTVTGLGKNSTLNGEFNLARITTTATDGEKTFGAGAASGEKAVFVNGVAEFTISADETVQIDGLPYGDYSVVENTAAANDVKIEHYDFKPENSTTSATVKVDAASLETVESAKLINRYEARPGSLSVTKEVTGTYKTNPKYDPDSEEFSFDITVTGAEGKYDAVKNARITDEIDGNKFVTVSPVNTTVTFANGKATVSLKAGETITVNGLPYGAEYTVTETNHIDGYDAPVYTNASGTITSDVTATVTVTNNRDSGSLKIFKNVADIPNEAIAYTEFTFRITGPEGFDMQTTVKGASAFEINGLIPGEYTITELTDKVKTIKFTDADGANGEWTLAGDNSDHTVIVTVRPDDITEEGVNLALATATITNTYTDERGKLTVEKDFVFTDNGEETEAPAEHFKQVYTFTVHKGDANGEKVGTLTVSDSKRSDTLSGLVPGEYTVVEDITGIEIPGWKLTASDNVTVTVEKGKETTANVTNTYDKQYGDLEFAKKVAFAAGSDEFSLEGKAFQFKVTYPDGETTEYITLDSSNDFKGTLAHLPVGTYIVEELTGDVLTVTEGAKVWRLDETESHAITVEVVAEGEKTEIAIPTITNTYSEELGSLTIKKDIDFNSSERPTAEELNKYSFDFEIKNNETKEVVYATVIGEGETTVNDLKPGTYTVTELFGESSQTPETITATGTDGVIRNWTIDKEGNHSAVVTVTVGENATIKVATVTNIYEEELASLTIKKIVEVDEAAPAAGNETGDEGESEVTTAPENEPEATTTPEPAVTTAPETEAQPAMDSDSVDAPAAPAEVPEATTASENEPEITTASESEAEVTTSAETEAEVTTSAEAEADVTTASESEADFVTDPATGESVPVKEYLINREFTFVITGPNGYSKTVTIKGNSEITLKDLIPGEYNIEELDGNETGWILTTTGDGKITVNSGSNNTAAIVNRYSKTLPMFGSLTINKTVIGGGEAAANATYFFDIEGIVSNPLTGPSKAVIDTVELNAANGWTKTLYNLVPGQYIVTERNADIPGYTLEVIANEVAEVDLGSNTVYNVTNKYTEKRGKLIITKTVEGGGDEAASKTYYFEITDPYGLKRIVSVVGNGTTEVDNLTWGTYTVKEMGADVDGFVLVKVTGEGAATLSAEQLVANIDITNKYEELGKLTLTKNYLGLNELTDKEKSNLSFTFKVTNSDETYSNTVILNAENNWTVTLTKLQPGEYTVSEVEESTKVNGYELINVSGDNVTVSIANNVAEKVTITNEYSKLGSLKIEKIVVGGGDAIAGKEYEFEIAGPDDYTNKVTVEANKSVTIDNLKPGTYTVKEVNGDIEGYNLEVTGNGVATVEVGQSETDVQITNTYKELGSLTIRKSVVVNGGSIPADKVFYFDITGPNGYSTTLELTANTVKTLDKLVPGVYTVTERTAEAQVSGYSLTVTADGNATVPEGGEAEVTVTNTYDQQVGSIEITKKVVGGNAITANKTYTFDITNDKTGNTVSVSITGEGTARVDNLAIGSYTVTERDANVEGYRLNVTGEGTVTVTMDDIIPVEITNTYDQIVGSLTITKNVVGGENAGAANKEYTFYVTGPDGYSETVRITGNGSATLENLVPGTYTVTEENASIPGYRYEVNGQGSVVVIADTESHITVTNIYTELRNIPVVKEWYVNGIRTAAPDNAVITVRLYADGVPEGSAITISAATNWFGSFNDLPVYAEDGHMISYFVVEDSFENWISTTSGNAEAGFVITNSTTTTTPDQPDEDQPDEPEPEIDRPEPDIPEPDIPLTDIPDEDIPTTEIPNTETPLVDIPDIDIPLFDMVPETGDDSKLALWISLMIASGLGISAILAALLAERKKSKANED